jgi:hypothetical protein
LKKFGPHSKRGRGPSPRAGIVFLFAKHSASFERWSGISRRTLRRSIGRLSLNRTGPLARTSPGCNRNLPFWGNGIISKGTQFRPTQAESIIQPTWRGPPDRRADVHVGLSPQPPGRQRPPPPPQPPTVPRTPAAGPQTSQHPPDSPRPPCSPSVSPNISVHPCPSVIHLPPPPTSQTRQRQSQNLQLFFRHKINHLQPISATSPRKAWRPGLFCSQKTVKPGRRRGGPRARGIKSLPAKLQWAKLRGIVKNFGQEPVQILRSPSSPQGRDGPGLISQQHRGKRFGL